MTDLPRILERAQRGDPKAAEELLPLVYDQLRKLAAHKMANHPPGQTLQPTALVHEAWLRLVGGGQWQRIELDESTLVLERPASEMLDIDAALEKLTREDALAADLVKLRYFLGLT